MKRSFSILSGRIKQAQTAQTDNEMLTTSLRLDKKHYS